MARVSTGLILLLARITATSAEASCTSTSCSTRSVVISAAAIPEEGELEIESVNMQLLQQGLQVVSSFQINTSVAAEAKEASAAAIATDASEGMEVGELAVEVPAAIETTTLDPTGITLNAAGDLEAFVAAVVFQVVAVIGCMIAFDVLRNRYPVMYKNNVITGVMPARISDGWFGWWNAMMSISVDRVADQMGLDQAMLIEFCHLGMRIMVIIGVPILFICGPINYFCGGNAAGDDHLSYLSFGNVENGSNLYWMYAFVVWGVAYAVQRSIVQAQQAFMHRRFKWLREMAPMRANTILVEGIPGDYCSDQKVHEFFEEVMPGDENVVSTYVAKDTSLLLPKVKALAAARANLHEAKTAWEAEASEPDKRPLMKQSTLSFGGKVDSIDWYTRQIAELEPEVAHEREQLQKLAASQVGGVNLTKGFVTFRGRAEAEIAVRLTGMAEDLSHWVLSHPPAPEDIQWNDLTQDPTAERFRQFIGYLFVIALYFLYMPAVIFITNLANVVNLGPMQPLWQGLAPTMGLLFMVSFLPTFLILNFQIFFTLKAGQWAQQVLQNWYFWFQIVFVVLATAVGQDTVGFTTALFTDPVSLFHVFATTMPYATHFFMNYQVVQYLQDAMCLMRYVQLGKFKTFSALWHEGEARAMSEPEDQDFYGMGGRSARFTIALVIGIVFGTLSPPICLLTFLLFALKRVVYGYLVPFAENKKTDLGGVFWVQSLRHLFIGNIIYVILMAGVLLNRSDSYVPAIIAGSSIFYVIYGMKRFEFEFNWVNLPFKDVLELEKDASVKHRPVLGVFKQPELSDDGVNTHAQSTSAAVMDFGDAGKNFGEGVPKQVPGIPGVIPRM